MSDTISKQDAIDALERIFDRCEEIEAHLPEGDPDRVGYKMYPDWFKVWNYIFQLPSAQPEQDREFIKLTVRNSNGRPYYSIIYLEFDDNGVGHDFEGYSSYSLDVISDYLKKYFMPSAQFEERTEERTETHACDLIKRQDAIDAAVEAADEWDGGYSRSREEIITLKLRMLPSAQPEQKKGEWINRSLNILYPDWERYTCSVCGKHSYNYDFCPNCGSYNGGGQSEVD